MLARLGVIALVFGLTLVTGLQAQENETEPEIDPEATQEQPAKQPPIEPAPVEPSLTTPTDKPRPEHDGGSAEDGDENPHQDPNIILGDGWAQWAMVVLSFFALGVSAWAVWLLRDTLKATRDAVRSADDAVEVTREIGQKQMRAYVNLQTADLHWSDEEPLQIKVIIENTGQTPARNVRRAFQEVIGPIGPPIALDPLPLENESGFSMRAKGEHAFFVLTDIVMSDDLIDKIESEKWAIWLKGRIEYEDVFGDSWSTSFIISAQDAVHIKTRAMGDTGYGDHST